MEAISASQVSKIGGDVVATGWIVDDDDGCLGRNMFATGELGKNCYGVPAR